MSKTKQKNKSEVEVLRGENRRLKSENRQLKREITQLKKRAHFFEEVVDEVLEDAEVKATCGSCGKGERLSYDLGRIKLIKCSICDYEKKTKKGLNE